ncbi:bifunctional DNA-formamidopyrimidine glycosylase/DNA-(apurinic or apyrimidinic site) lyase [Chloroflexota bacterium]
MPELPEVETIKNELAPHVIGRRITDIVLRWDGMVKQPPAGEFCARVIGREITALRRRGKYLFFSLNGGGIMVMHMKMTGSLLVNPADDRFTRAVIKLDNGDAVHFWDPRKFGRMWLIDDEKSVTDKLGPEPLDEEFTPEMLTGILRGRNAPVKAIILDQARIAGIGNMYADESLYDAKIHPMRPAASLSSDEVGRLHAAIIRVLQSALASKGASVRNYIRPGGEIGTAHFEFRVAHGVGRECPIHHVPIKRIVVRGRGSYYCPVCQPET